MVQKAPPSLPPRANSEEFDDLYDDDSDDEPLPVATTSEVVPQAVVPTAVEPSQPQGEQLSPQARADSSS